MVAVPIAAGGAVAEERRGFGVQHLHGDSGWEWGAGSLGPQYLPLPHAAATGKSPSPHLHLCKQRRRHQISLLPFSGASRRRRGHAGSWLVTWAAAPPPEVQSRAELGPDRNYNPPPLQSQQGHHRLFYRQVPEELTGGHVFSHSPHMRQWDGNNSTRLCLLWQSAIDKELAAVYSIRLLTAALWNCGPYRDKLHKHGGQQGGRDGGRETEWVLANAAVLVSP